MPTRRSAALAISLTLGVALCLPGTSAAAPRTPAAGETASAHARPADGTIYDFNGDGTDDLVSTGWTVTDELNSYRCCVTARYSSTGALGWPGGYYDTTQGSPGFHSAVAAGDINGDGYDDLVFGTPRNRGAAGAVWVAYGGPSGLDMTALTTLSQITPGVPGISERGDNFGAAIAVGDIDHDGYADIVIGAPGEDVGSYANSGAVTILYGYQQGVNYLRARTLTLDSPGVPGTPGTVGSFGFPLAIADVNGDHFGDLAIGFGHQPTTSRLVLVRGSSQGVTLTGARTVDTDFPHMIVSGDVDGDGYQDLIAAGRGVAKTDIEQIRGGPDGLSNGFRRFSEDTPGIPGRYRGAGDWWAHSVATADLDGDGIDDVAVGDPSATVNGWQSAGSVTVINGSDTGLDPQRAYIVSQGSPHSCGAPEPGDMFGANLTAGHFGPGGAVTVQVGSPGELDGRDPNHIYDRNGMISTLGTTSATSDGTCLTGWDLRTGMYSVRMLGTSMPH